MSVQRHSRYRTPPTSPASAPKVQHSEPMKKERPAVSRENVAKYPTPKEPVTKTQEIRTQVKNEPVSHAPGVKNPTPPERKNPSLSGNKEIRQTATKRSVQKNIERNTVKKITTKKGRKQ